MSELFTRPEPTHIAFVCVQNAGRSQMAYAFACQEVAERGLEDTVELYTGGTRPAEHVHENVRRTMTEAGLAIGDRSPQAITPAQLQHCDLVITMGCDAEDVCPATWSGDSRDWGLPDPEGEPPDVVAGIRDDVERRVSALFDELDACEEGSRG